MGIICLIMPLAFLGCSGDDGATGPAGPEGPEGPPGPGAGLQLESCTTCHKDAGDKHQASYDELYQDGVIEVADVEYNFSDNASIVSFNMTKDGADFDCTQAYNLNIYFAPYTDNGAFQFEPAAARLSIKGKLESDAGLCTSTLDNSVNLTDNTGLVIVYGYDELVGTLPPSRVRQVKYPYAGLLKLGDVDYVSAANNAGCVKCHTDPYLKHGNIYAQVGGDNTTDFMTCKACHLDNGEGGHYEWQLLVDDPARWAEIAALTEANDTEFEDEMTAEELAKYAYTTRLVNDVHMSHAMEFPYPQSMANCATCHEGKLDLIFTDNNFVVETCKSCHPVTGSDMYSGGIAGNIPYRYAPPYDNNGTPPTTTFALNTIAHEGMAYDGSVVCNVCHFQGNPTGAPVFSAIHTGYDKIIYADAEGTKYSDEIKVTIDSASFDNNLLTITFSAAGTAGGLSAEDIIPTVLVGLYGYDSKDFYIGPHERDADRNRFLEFEVNPADNTTANPRFTIVTAEGGQWEVVADLSMWADLFDNVVKRAEIGVMPALAGTDDVEVALNAVSRTFDLGANAFDDGFYGGGVAGEEGKGIVKVTDGCNNCHDALATTFHSPDRGGSVVVCRMCHIVKNGGSHLEMQSRSIDSYAHAIHSFQGFDIGDVDFSDPVLALHWEDHTELFPYPTHGITNCKSCHVAGAFNVPDQSKSLSGVFSASDDVAGRSISGVPSYIAGPASRACGACHRAEMINEDAAGELASFNQHTQSGGYLLLASEYDILEVIDATQALISP